MKNTDNKSDAAIIRQKAEEQLKKKAAKTVSKLSEVEMLKLVHELEVHQIELELQNEELMVAKEKAEVATEKFTTLYDYAPSGYFILSNDGKIIELNLVGSQMLGKERVQLKNELFSYFVSDDTKSIFNVFLEKIFINDGKESCDVILASDSNEPIYVRLNGIVSNDRLQCFVTMDDISVHKQIENIFHRTSGERDKELRCLYTISELIREKDIPQEIQWQKSVNLLAQAYMHIEISACCLTIGEREYRTSNFKKTEWSQNRPIIVYGKIVGSIEVCYLEKRPDEYDGPFLLEEERLLTAIADLMGKSAERMQAEDKILFQNEEKEKRAAELVIANKELLFQNEEKEKRTAELVNINADLLLARNFLSESEMWYRSMFHSNHSIMMLIDPATGNIKDANSSACKFYGWSLADMVSMNISDINTLPKEKVNAEMKKAAAENRSKYFFTHRVVTGELRDVEVQTGPVVIGESTFLYSIVRDLTESKKAQKDLDEERARLMGAITGTNAGTWEWNVETGVTIFNERWAEIIGYTLEELAPVSIKSWIQFTHPDDLSRSNEMLERHFQGELDYYDIEVRMKHKNGSWIWVHDRGKVFKWTSEGKPLELFGTHLDISDRMRVSNLFESRVRIGKYSQTHTYDEVLQFVLDETELITESCIGFFHFLEKDQKTLRLQMWSTNTMQNMCSAEGKGHLYNITEAGVWAECVSTRKPVVHNNYATLPNRKGMPEGHAAVIRELVIPIIRENEIVAILGVGNKIINYTQHDIDFMIVLADMAWDIVIRKRTEELLEKSEIKMRSILDNSIDAIGIHIDGIWEMCNRSALRLFGLSSAEEVLGRSILNVIAPGEQTRIQSFVKGRMDEHIVPTKYLTRGIRTDGIEFEMEVTVSVSLVEHKRHVLTIFRDVTEQLRTEEKLRQLSVAVEQSPTSIVITDKYGSIEYVNSKFISLTGYSYDEAIGKNPRLLKSGKTTSEQYTKMWQTITSGDVWRGEFENRKKNGEVYFESATISPIVNTMGDTTHYIAVKEDITERMHAEESSRESEAIITQFINNSPVYIFIKDNQMKSLRLSKNYETMLGKPIQELLGKRMTELFPTEFAERIVADDLQVLQEGKQIYVDEEFNGRQYTTIKFPIIVAGKPTYLAGYTLDITDMKRAEKELRNSEEKFRFLVQNSRDIIFSANAEGIFTFVSDAWTTLLGHPIDSVVGQSFRKFVHPDDEPLYMEFVKKQAEKSEQYHSVEYRVQHIDGSWRWHSRTVTLIYENDSFVSFEGMARDITERKIAEEKLVIVEKHLRQSEKMEAIGQLAGGIAHDFNNVLTGIIGFTSMSQRHAESNPVLKKNLEKVLAASDRAKHLTQQILTFSRQGIEKKMVISILPIIKEVMDLLKASIPSSIIMESDLRGDTKPILADTTKIHEIILNLATNAVHAMKQKGILKFRLYTEIFEQLACVDTGELSPGEYLVLEVADTGSGMDSWTISKAFEPFFTTKGVGEGTGMGLSVVLGIIQSHGGNIRVESIVGKGTTFKIYLPVAEGTVSGFKDEKTRREIKGTERILFVDDEQILRDMAEMEFTYLGYKVTCMEDGKEALAFFEKNETEIDILITDQTMPGLTGIELAEKALQIRKNLPIILCTGFSKTVNAEQAKEIGVREFVMKPYDINALSQLIQNIFNNRKNEV